MKAIDVSLDDKIVVDCEGTVWLALSHRWFYISDTGLSDDDSRAELPEAYEPYIALDKGAQEIVRIGLAHHV